MPEPCNVFMTVVGPDDVIGWFVEMLKGSNEAGASIASDRRGDSVGADELRSPFYHVRVTASAGGYFAFYGLTMQRAGVVDDLARAFPALWFSGVAGRDNEVEYHTFSIRPTVLTREAKEGVFPEWIDYPCTPEMTAGEFPNRHPGEREG
jgi:hypothetical protein